MNKPLILVVEDDPSVRNLITTTLKTNDYRYVVAPNGSAAIMGATSRNPEIILLDLGLPDMDGMEVLDLCTGTGAPLHFTAYFSSIWDAHAAFKNAERLRMTRG